MKYEVIGWTRCGNGMYPPHKNITASVDAAIVKEIRKHGYLFGGDAHEDYCPVLNDGTYASYSWRGWGGVMALAYGVEGERAYMCAYMNNMIKPTARKYPDSGSLPEDYRIVPKESLAEIFVMRLADDMFEKVKAGTKTIEMRLFDDKRKQVDIGDYIEFRKLSDENERVIRRVADIDIWETFEKAFSRIYYEKEKRIEGLRFTPEQLGAPENSDLKSIVDGMYKYYDKEQEKKYGVIAFTLEKPEHSCRTSLRIYTDFDNCLPLLNESLEQAVNDVEEYERLYDEWRETDLTENALNEISADYKKFWHFFEYGVNEDYNADVNVMVRETLKNLFGSEEKFKAIREKYCVLIQLEIFAVTVKDSDEPKQNLSLDKDVIEFLNKSGVKLKLGTRTI